MHVASGLLRQLPLLEHIGHGPLPVILSCIPALMERQDKTPSFVFLKSKTEKVIELLISTTDY